MNCIPIKLLKKKKKLKREALWISGSDHWWRAQSDLCWYHWGDTIGLGWNQLHCCDKGLLLPRWHRNSTEKGILFLFFLLQPFNLTVAPPTIWISQEAGWWRRKVVCWDPVPERHGRGRIGGIYGPMTERIQICGNAGSIHALTRILNSIKLQWQIYYCA